jgi:hypothetical protein
MPDAYEREKAVVMETLATSGKAYAAEFIKEWTHGSAI